MNSEFDHFMRTALTHLCRIEFPTIINWNSPFLFIGMLGGIFQFIQVLIENYASKQWRP